MVERSLRDVYKRQDDKYRCICTNAEKALESVKHVEL